MSNEPVVLLHGFYHGAWAWTEVIAELAGRGRTAVAVDMAAHGLHTTSPASAGRRPFASVAYATEASPVSGVGLDAVADLLVAQLESVGKGKPVSTLPAGLQRLFIAQADTAFPSNPTTVFELSTAHSAFVSAPARVADIIADCTAATGQQ
ncbi:alpha/beta fold hydrolase [Amycolatopsis sp. NPDC023774]|uniref:alpha/beta fold hydrolase n=1 Tax=Amycolatopsis sp. NPDC023774 TaxID=3155015 RepID=UPI003410FC74